MATPLNDLLEYLDKKLTEISEATPCEPSAAWDEGRRLIGVVGHAKELLRQFGLPEEKRTNSIIQSSWATVSSVCQKLDLLHSHAGDKGLQQDLADFLESGSKMPGSGR